MDEPVGEVGGGEHPARGRRWLLAKQYGGVVDVLGPVSTVVVVSGLLIAVVVQMRRYRER